MRARTHVGLRPSDYERSKEGVGERVQLVVIPGSTTGTLRLLVIALDLNGRQEESSAVPCAVGSLMEVISEVMVRDGFVMGS